MEHPASGSPAEAVVVSSPPPTRAGSMRNSEPSEPHENPTPQLVPPPTHAVAGTIGEKHVLVMVGLPARGKTHMLERYLSFFHGATTRVFNVGEYRRRSLGEHALGAASRTCSDGHFFDSLSPGMTSNGRAAFFDPLDSSASAARLGFATQAMEDLKAFLFEGEHVERTSPSRPAPPPAATAGRWSEASGAFASSSPSPLRAVDSGRVAIFDATNSTRSRRAWLREQLAGLPLKLLYIESVCTDEKIVEANIWNAKIGLPDFSGLTAEEAFRDFKARVKHYEAVYEPMDEEELSWIKLINCGKRVEINNIHGFLLGRIVQFLANMHNTVHSIYLSRHGQSMYNREGKIGGDSPLSPAGEAYAHALADYVGQNMCRDAAGDLVRARLWTSSLKRTIQTARYIPHPRLVHPDGHEWEQCAPRVMRNLDEIYAGVCDGMTYAEIEAQYPEEFALRKEDKLGYRYPRGESYLDVISRLDPLVHELESYSEPVLIVGHQAVLRLIYAYFTGRNRESCPRIAFPLNTVVKLTPRTHDCDEQHMCWDPASGTWGQVHQGDEGANSEPPSH